MSPPRDAGLAWARSAAHAVDASAAGAAATPAAATPAAATPAAATAGAAGDPQWYRDAIIYEVHVRAFRDSNGDGIGDFRGLIEKLDYLRDLGVTALWLLPFYPSPLRDDGYDIADYANVNPAYGTLRDAETFIREAHKRGLRVITELVCNHTSDQHPWFQRARAARPGSPWRDFYVWSDTPDRYPDARIIFKDFEASNWTWDPVAGAYYWHRFYSHQPDLNFDNPRVRQAITKAMDFWLDRGVDGLRLDAVPYLFEREGTDCENLPETHEFLRELRRHVDENYADRMLLAEANQWPEDSAAYFGDGDECHMAFNFPVMPRMFMAIQMEDRLPLVDIIEQTPAIPDASQWALFLRNHDELTLEMVTDEERDYMYRVYAGDPKARINVGIRRRLAPLLGNHRRRIELMNGLLFSLPGTPVIYYGDEIGMGDNVYLGDRDSVRTPMQWNGDRNAGFSSATREQLYLPVISDPEHQFEAVNVAVEQANPHSLLWWMKRLISLRKRHAAFARGDLELLTPENRHVLAFTRRLGEETVLVVANLSRFFQPVALDLTRYEGRQPIEMFGRIEFPPVGAAPYPLSLGPHEFLWFTLEAVSGRSDGAAPEMDLPTLAASGFSDLLTGKGEAALASTLVGWVSARPWFRGRGRRINDGVIADIVEIKLGSAAVTAADAALVVLVINYSAGESDTYLIPLTTATPGRDALTFADGVSLRVEPEGVRVANLAPRAGAPVADCLVDASFDTGFTSAVGQAIARRRRLRGNRGSLLGHPDASVARGRQAGALTLQLRHVLEPPPDPEAEVVRFLTRTGATWVPQIGGHLEYQGDSGSGGSTAFLREAIADDGNLADTTRQALGSFLESAAANPDPAAVAQLTTAELARVSMEDLPDVAHELAGSYLGTARSTGNRIGEFHLRLASWSDDPAFAPEPYNRQHQRALYQAIDSVAVTVLRQLDRRVFESGSRAGADAATLVALGPEIQGRLRLLLNKRFGGERIRIHGALRLDCLANSGRGLVLLDLQGDTGRPASERRIKRSPLRDVASMIGSYQALAMDGLRGAVGGGSVRPEDAAGLDLWARRWCLWVAASFLRGYREETSGATLLPAADDEWVALLDALRLHRAMQDLATDLRDDPEQLPNSVRAALELLGH